METVKRIIDWLSEGAADAVSDSAADDVIFEIDTLEDAARIGMAWS